MGEASRSRATLPTLASSKFDYHPMARWPQHTWTTWVTYGLIFILFPLLCVLAYAYVRGWDLLGL